MSSTPRYDTGENLPEIVPKGNPSSYIYSTENDSPAPDRTSQAISAHGHKPRTGEKWQRWPCLLVLGLILAVIGGIIGGLVGKAIEHKKTNHAPVDNTRQCLNSNNNTRPSNTSCTTNATNTTDTANTTFAIPSTGCPDTHMQAFQSSHMNVTYRILCNTGWLENDFFAVSVATPSECIEACKHYNDGPEEVKLVQCVGVGFIPAFVNQTLAMKLLVPSRPFNCWLKSGTRGRGKNDRDFEVVSLCLDARC